MTLALARGLISRLLAEAERALPEEACGLLLGSGARIEQIVPARNVHCAPQTHFEIDPQALVAAYRSARQGGPGVLGYYHSQPGGPAEPSATDRAMAPGDGSIWAIVGQGGVTFWRNDEGAFAKLSYSLSDG